MQRRILNRFKLPCTCPKDEHPKKHTCHRCDVMLFHYQDVLVGFLTQIGLKSAAFWNEIV